MFSVLICPKNTDDRKFNSLTKTVENVDFLSFFKTSFFWSKKHSFLSSIPKNDLFWLDLPKRHTWQKVRFFDKNHGLTLLENFEFLDFFKSFFFWCRKDFFIQNNKKTIFPCLICPKYINDKKSDFFYESHGLTPLENFDFVDFFKTFFSGLESILFYLEDQKTIFCGLIAQKKHRW